MAARRRAGTLILGRIERVFDGSQERIKCRLQRRVWSPVHGGNLPAFADRSTHPFVADAPDPADVLAVMASDVMRVGISRIGFQPDGHARQYSPDLRLDAGRTRLTVMRRLE